MNRQAQARDFQLLVQAGDLPSRCTSARVDLADGSRRVVTPVAVGVGRAELLAEQERARRELEDVVVPFSIKTLPSLHCEGCGVSMMASVRGRRAEHHTESEERRF